MMYKILKLDEDKWTKFEFIHYYPGKFSLFLIFIGPSGVPSNIRYNRGFNKYPQPIFLGEIGK